MADENLEVLKQIRDLLTSRLQVPAPRPPQPPAAPAGPNRRELATAGITEWARQGSGKIFDALLARDRKTPLREEVLKALVYPQARVVFQNLSVELLRSLGKILPQVRGGVLGRILRGTVFNADPLTRAADAQVGAAGALTAAAQSLTSAAGALAAGGGAGSTASFVSQALGGRLAGLSQSLPQLVTSLGGGFGRTGAIIGAGAAGAIVGAKGAGFGIAGLGKFGGALLGGAITAGLTAGLLFGIGKLFGARKTPAERAAEIEAIVARQQVTWPEPLEREVGFRGGAFGEVDYGYGNAPRVVPAVVVNVSAMDARSFLERAPEIASAVRRAMLDLHPINGLIREAF